MKTNTIAFSALMFVLVGCNQDRTAEPVAVDTSADPPQVSAPAPAPDLGAIQTCNIERVDEQTFKPATPVVQAGGTTRISGWLIDTRTTSVPSDVQLRLLGADGTVAGEQAVVMWRNRPDIVAAHKGENAYLASGFAVDMPLAGIAPGTYSIVLTGSGAAGAFSCDADRTLTIML